ncbi:MAG: NAD/FAD-dependent oxidoreductase [Bacteroidetes bacterium QS_9_68_14]|nr:MAG: NAD/FAD-dependent oxidoreductase [Bacteroidetes bacterium QS_9_68_14]
MSLAIVGAGLSGLAAAYALRDTDLPVTFFEKSRGVAGRAATRGRGDVRYDHGANHFKTKSDRFESLVRDDLPTDDLEKIRGDVWTFEEDGDIQEGDPEKNAEAKWTYRDGVSRLGKHLAEAAGADVRTETRVTLLSREDGAGNAWTLTDAEGREHGPFEAVLLTPPAPQTADLLKASRLGDDVLQEHLTGALAPVPYRTQLTLVLAYRRRVERPDGCYGLLNTDGAHEIAWLSFEEEKPGHVPAPGSDDTAPESVLVAQMGPDWSRPRFRSEREALVPEVTALVGGLLGQDLARPRWADKQGWRYALPEEAADADALADGAEAGLFFAGDALAGQGRVGAAVESGLDAGARLREAL